MLTALEQKSQVVEFTVEFDTFQGSQSGDFLEVFAVLASTNDLNITVCQASFLELVFGFVFVIAGCTDLFYFSASDSKSAIVKGLILAVIIVGISQYFLTKTLDKFFPPKHIKDEKNNLDV